MNLYLLERKHSFGYDEYYDSCVVSANSEEGALRIHPGGISEDIAVTLVGISFLGDEPKVICASFNGS